MKRYEDRRSSTGYFVVDPLHLAEGLEAAHEAKSVAVRISPLDSRTKNISFDPADLIGQDWIRRLTLDEGLTPPKDALASALYKLGELEELTLVESTPLDYAGFKRLKVLNIHRGTSLQGLETLRGLQSLYVGRWLPETLPEEMAKLAATSIRISAAGKLNNVDPIFRMPHLKKLHLQDLKKLNPITGTRHLNSVEELRIETVNWTEFEWLHSTSVLSFDWWTKFKSLKPTIGQLTRLRTLYIWECMDGDMQPILDHPTLKELYMDKSRKHYTHKEAVLQAALKAK